MQSQYAINIGLWLPIIIVGALVALLIGAFEVWMIVDAAINKQLSDKAKAWWIIGMIILHPFVAVVYFFTQRRKS